MSVTIVVGKRHLLAGLSLLVLTALVGLALVVPAISDATTTTYTRSASCAGLDFYPADTRSQYDSVGTLRVFRDQDFAGYGTGVFRCDPGLPNGAVVKEVQFTVLLYTGAGVSTCSLKRSGLTTATAAAAQELGSVSFVTQTTTGPVRLTDSSIVNATVDNTSWGYWYECTISNPAGLNVTPWTGIYGADVIYTITAAKG